MFDNSENSVDEIAATLAHEVKNPVSLIKANIDYIELTGAGDVSVYEKNFKIMKRELNKITNLIVDFIELSKPAKEEPGEKVYILEVLSDVIDDIKSSMAVKEIEFELTAEGNAKEFYISANKSHIDSLFFNIYKNAAEALDGLPDALIKTELSKNGQYILLKITDNGVGLSGTKDIGSPFVTTKEGGSGLGLLICRNIVKKYNGEFFIENNKEGRGCTVTIRFWENYESL